MACSIFINCFLFLVSVSVVSFSNKGVHALTEEEIKPSDHRHTVHINSLLPSSVCSSSTKGQRSGESLRVAHRHGPCSHLTLEKSKVPTATQFLMQDQSRVNSIQSQFALNSSENTLKTSKVTLPAKSGSSLGTGNYFVVVGLGTPKKQLSLIFDTASDLMWTQCQPCAVSCYKQKDPIFNPSASTTYSNISCTSLQCSQLSSATSSSPKCSSSTCIYGIQYGDRSFSVGFFGTETLSLTPTDVFPNFFFGCGQNNQGLFGSTAGLLGLGRNKLSMVSQTASKYGRYFSYCLPSSSSSGYLTFGKGRNSNALKFTTLSINSRGPSFYFIDIVAIKCGTTMLSIPKAIFQTAGMIIDSGTVITRLPPTAYSALRTEFRKQMAKYPSAPALSILDTCYNFSNYTTVTIPVVTFYFGGNVQVPIPGLGTLFGGGDTSQICLAFAGNSVDSDLGIFANNQQQTLNVVYDVAGGKLGFGLNGCS